MNRPTLIGKAAFSLDGYMSRPAGEGQWITSPEAREDANRLRAEVDAVMIGAQTARIDNPRLTVRSLPVPVQPWRIVLSRTGSLPPHLHLLTDEHRERTRVLQPASWNDLWNQLHALEIRSVLVEGGGHLLDQLAKANCIDESVLYYAPFNLEDPSLTRADTFRRLPLKDPVTTAIGPDLKIRGKAEPG